MDVDGLAFGRIRFSARENTLLGMLPDQRIDTAPLLSMPLIPEEDS